MRAVFVDTLYWIAFINPHDQWHESALRIEAALRGCAFVTTEAVLFEVLNYFSGFGAEARIKISRVVEQLLQRADVETVASDSNAFSTALALYKARPDKSYSLTDCLSMHVMRERGITDVLTHDHHFTQEGFNVLL